ncbi:MAG: phosphoglycerate dehydrogenase [bacterium]|nr:phosphoglycerate dehydrogenase [bacterium]
MAYKVLVSDPLSQEGIDILQAHADVNVDVKTGLKPEELMEIIGQYDGLVIRSGTQVTAEVLARADKLKVVGRAGVGVDNVDIPAATQRGVIVMNTPGGNTISTAEHSWALLISLARNVPQAAQSMREGRWDRKKYTGTELFGKTLGVIGLGRVGREVGRRAQAFGMKVMGYDPFIADDMLKKLGFEGATVEEIFKAADFITVHTPKTEETSHLIDDRAFAMMKKGVRVINCARGGIIDEDALLRALESGKCGGAALDVYEQEPPDPKHPLLSREDCVCTPHLGASTEEAQTNVALDIARNVLDVLTGGEVRNAVNIPSVSPEVRAALSPYLELAEKLGMFAIQYFNKPLSKLEVAYSGGLAEYETAYLSLAVLKGALSAMMNETVNFVNAPILAEQRQIQVVESKAARSESYSSLITVKMSSDGSSAEVSGTTYETGEARIVQVDGYHIEAKPYGTILFFQNVDKPGAIGQLCTVLGSANINIADMTLGRQKPGGYAVTVCNVDCDVPKAILEQLKATNAVRDIKVINLEQR